ncbi:uncharacterized protein C20orf96 homolog isoform X5 [Tachyglossus aculeatus]|uniref:uncharacterized protein C20orf96 homolog isoform X5 n=1 Tax=Tachyglossus aculeatus TaxID=9261 RepID=UPI0018F64FC6|nr:uncharacterized protein C20orf96 homolog isoform X5 [Tachyglossus aculeatus]
MEARIGNLGGFRRPRDRGAPGLNPPRPWLSLSLGLEQDPHPSPEPKVPGRPPLPPIHAGHARPGGRTAAAPHHNAGPPAPSGRRTHPKALAGADLDPVRLHEANQILRTMIATLESSNQMQLHIAKRQLAETEEREKAKMEVLQRQLSQLRARNRKSQEELNVLLAYMDQDFPLKAVQISGLLRQVQQLKDAQQDESEELRLMRRTVLGSMERKAAEAQEKILRRLANKKIRPYEEGLAQKTKANKVLVEQISYFQRELTFGGPLPPGPPRQLVATLEEEVPRLEMEVKTLQSQTPGLLREEIFPDVLLRKPKCEPDTDVCLDFPREERLPF